MTAITRRERMRIVHRYEPPRTGDTPLAMALVYALLLPCGAIAVAYFAALYVLAVL